MVIAYPSPVGTCVGKAKLVAPVAAAFQALDDLELARELDKRARAAGRVLPVFIEVNIGVEDQKSGVLPVASPALVERILGQCPHLRLCGVMTVPPYDPDPRRSRPYFEALRRLARDLERRFGLSPLQLSMGMSEDFEAAVEEGATLVRLGRVLFGERRIAP